MKCLLVQKRISVTGCKKIEITNQEEFQDSCSLISFPVCRNIFWQSITGQLAVWLLHISNCPARLQIWTNVARTQENSGMMDHKAKIKSEASRTPRSQAASHPLPGWGFSSSFLASSWLHVCIWFSFPSPCVFEFKTLISRPGWQKTPSWRWRRVVFECWARTRARSQFESKKSS